jgi:hypothetical protein
MKRDMADQTRFGAVSGSRAGFDPGEVAEIAADLRKYAKRALPLRALAMNTAAGILEGVGAQQCEPMIAGEDGWSEWIHPMPGYVMECCDCGLRHEAEFAIRSKGKVPASPANEGEDANSLIVFRMRRKGVGR